jgi:hypothetical protein
MKSILIYIILFILFIQCNSSCLNDYLKVNLNIKNFCYNNTLQAHDYDACIDKSRIIYIKQYDLNTQFLDKYNTTFANKIDVNNLKSLINDIGNKHEDVNNPSRAFTIVNFTNNNNTVKYVLTYSTVKNFLCKILNTTDNIEIKKIKYIERKEKIYKGLTYKIKSNNNQIIIDLDLDSYEYYNDTIPIYYNLTFNKKSNNYICIYSNGSELNLTKLDRFSEYCFKEKSTKITVNLLDYINVDNKSIINHTNNKIEGINYNITTNYTLKIIDYVNYEKVYNKTKYINSLECVCTKEKIISIETDKIFTAIFCTNTSLNCLLLENSISLIQKNLSYILAWENTTLYYYYYFKDNKTDIYIKSKYYNDIIIKFLNKNLLLEKKNHKRSLLDGNLYEFHTNLKHSIYNIGKDISNIIKDINNYNEAKNYIFIDTEYILKSYETLPYMYDLNNNEIEIKNKTYELSEYSLELPNNINSTSLHMSDIKSILFLIIIILSFIIMLLPLCFI